MLVLSRKIGESIVIGDGIKVTILRMDGLRIRVGIKAPECIPILREEIIFDATDGSAAANEANQWCKEQAGPSAPKSR